MSVRYSAQNPRVTVKGREMRSCDVVGLKGVFRGREKEGRRSSVVS